MTIEKAIELLQQDLDDPGCVDIMDLNNAQALAIEALKLLREVRTDVLQTTLVCLPGETPE